MQTLPSPQCCPTALRLPGHSSLHRSVGCLGCLPQLSSKPPCLQGRERISVTGEEWPQRQRRDRTSWGSSIQQQGRGHAGGRGGCLQACKEGEKEKERRKGGKGTQLSLSPGSSKKRSALQPETCPRYFTPLLLYPQLWGSGWITHREERGGCARSSAEARSFAG